MTVTINGTTGITTPAVASSGGDTNTTLAASTSVTTPLVTNAGTLALSATGSNIVTASTNGAERMRIDSSGNLLVGTTTAGGVGYTFGPTAGDARSKRSGTGPASHLTFFNDNGQVGQIYSNGSSTSYATSSDYRLKENIAPMTGALATVSALKPVTYTWKVDGSSGQGFIAHELQEVVPDCVVGEKDAVEIVDDLDAEGRKIGTKEVPRYQGIDTSFLVATLTASIQELKAIVDAQAERITALENK